MKIHKEKTNKRSEAISPSSSVLSRESVISSALSDEENLDRSISSVKSQNPLNTLTKKFKDKLAIIDFLKNLLIVKDLRQVSLLCSMERGSKNFSCENLIMKCEDKFPLIISVDLVDGSTIGIYAEYGLNEMNSIILFGIRKDDKIGRASCRERVSSPV